MVSLWSKVTVTLKLNNWSSKIVRGFHKYLHLSQRAFGLSVGHSIGKSTDRRPKPYLL